jgi:hypothetical protein
MPEEARIEVRASLRKKTVKTIAKIVERHRVEKQEAGVSYQVETYADLVKVKRVCKTQAAQVGGGARGKCSGFSAASRRRLMQRMCMWNLEDVHLSFVTLTYPGEYSSDWQTWKRDLDVFLRWLKRNMAEAIGCIWRVEFQKRGAPHFHLLLASSEKTCTCEPRKMMVKGREKYVHTKSCRVNGLRTLVGQKWAGVVRDGYLSSGGDAEAYSGHYERHLQAGTGIDVVVGRKQMMAYVSKYLAKVDQVGLDGWGRNWGCVNMNGKLDFNPVEVVNMEEEEAVKMRRMVVGWLKSRKQVRYADRLARKGSYSVMGLYGEVAMRMTEAAQAGFICISYFSTRKGAIADKLVRKGLEGMPFMDRVNMGGYGTDRQVREGDTVVTPDGVGVVSLLRYCDILNRYRVSVHGRNVNGIYHLSEIRLQNVRRVPDAYMNVPLFG